MMKQKYRIALAGNPNCGKTCIFNALTGARQHVGNYPGVTVESKSGAFELNGANIELIDLPGVYSLSSSSPEEDVVFHQQDLPSMTQCSASDLMYQPSAWVRLPRWLL